MQKIGNPATGKDFIGRDKELNLLIEYLKLGQSVAILAPRRFGKTSLVLEVLRQMKNKKFYTAYVDIFKNPTLDLLSSEIMEEVLKNHKLHKLFLKTKNNAGEMIRNIKLKAVIDDFQFIIDFADRSKSEWELLSETIDFVDTFSKKHKNKIICAYDEFGDIERFSSKESLVKLFRSKIQRHVNSTYIFSGSYESIMQTMFVTPKSPFYRFARIIRLGYLEPDPLFKYINKSLYDLHIYPDSEYVKAIIDFTMGHPYYVQLAIQQFILYNAINRKTPTIEELRGEMLSAEKDYLEKVWEGISGNREMVHFLIAAARSGQNIYTRLKPANINIARASRRLEGMGLLFKDEIRGYYISDPLLKLWITENI